MVRFFHVVDMFAERPYAGNQLAVVRDAAGMPDAEMAAFLHRHCGEPVDARVEQGYELGRPSLLFLRTSGSPESPAVSVGGRVVPVVRGELL